MKRTLTPKQSYQAVAQFLDEYRQSLMEATEETSTSGPLPAGWRGPVELPYSDTFGDLAISVTLLRGGAPVDPYLWDSWRSCLPAGGITPRRAYAALIHFLDRYAAATSCPEAATLRRYLDLTHDSDGEPALLGRWLACIRVVLDQPRPGGEQSSPARSGDDEA